jgi:hypothetical protein
MLRDTYFQIVNRLSLLALSLLTQVAGWMISRIDAQPVGLFL